MRLRTSAGRAGGSEAWLAAEGTVTKAGNTYLIELANDVVPEEFGLDDSGLTASFVNAVDEIQQITVDATGGTFLLSLPDAVTSATGKSYFLSLRGDPVYAEGYRIASLFLTDVSQHSTNVYRFASINLSRQH